MENQFLFDYPMPVLKLIIEELSNEIEGWKRPDGKLEEKGKEYNDKLDKVLEVYDRKMKEIFNKIKV